MPVNKAGQGRLGHFAMPDSEWDSRAVSVPSEPCPF